jgi:hypothetical protein
VSTYLSSLVPPFKSTYLGLGLISYGRTEEQQPKAKLHKASQTHTPYEPVKHPASYRKITIEPATIILNTYTLCLGPMKGAEKNTKEGDEAHKQPVAPAGVMQSSADEDSEGSAVSSSIKEASIAKKQTRNIKTHRFGLCLRTTSFLETNASFLKERQDGDTGEISRARAAESFSAMVETIAPNVGSSFRQMIRVTYTEAAREDTTRYPREKVGLCYGFSSGTQSNTEGKEESEQEQVVANEPGQLQHIQSRSSEFNDLDAAARNPSVAVEAADLQQTLAQELAAVPVFCTTTSVSSSIHECCWCCVSVWWQSLFPKTPNKRMAISTRNCLSAAQYSYVPIDRYVQQARMRRCDG